MMLEQFRSQIELTKKDICVVSSESHDDIVEEMLAIITRILDFGRCILLCSKAINSNCLKHVRSYEIQFAAKLTQFKFHESELNTKVPLLILMNGLDVIIAETITANSKNELNKLIPFSVKQCISKISKSLNDLHRIATNEIIDNSQEGNDNYEMFLKVFVS